MSILGSWEDSLAFHGYFAELGDFDLQLDGTHVFAWAKFVNGFIANVTELGNYLRFVEWDYKHSTDIGHATSDIGWVWRVK